MTSTTEDVKARALAMLMTGTHITEVSRILRVGEATLKKWRDEEAHLVTLEQQGKIGDLIISYIRQSFETLIKQSEFFSNETWLLKQKASDVAVLHGVIADKMHRLLEAMTDTQNMTAPPTLEVPHETIEELPSESTVAEE